MVASHLPHTEGSGSQSPLSTAEWGEDWTGDADVGNNDMHYSVCPYCGATYFPSLPPLLHYISASTASLLGAVTLF